MIQLTEEMKELIDNALANGTPCILATASGTGEPGVSYRGSMMAFGDESLAYWDRTKRAGLEHVEANSNVVVMLRHPGLGKAWKFHGEAKIYRDGPIREQIMSHVVEAELKRDSNREGFGVVIHLNRIALLSGEVIQQRD
jgi:hypothetical protein